MTSWKVIVYFQQGSAPAHCARDTIMLLRRSKPDFIAPHMWPPNSPDLNTVDCAIWSIMQHRVYQTRVHDILLLVIVTLTMIGQPRNSIFIQSVAEIRRHSVLSGQDSTMWDIVWLLMSTSCISSHNGFLDVSRSNGGLRISGCIGQLSCLAIFSTSLSVAAFLRRATCAYKIKHWNYTLEAFTHIDSWTAQNLQMLWTTPGSTELMRSFK